MFNQVNAIAKYIVESFIHIWPYLLVTIPIAVAVQLSGVSRHINKAFKAQPVVAILLATLVGAFSPFCSCGVIPIIAALLIGGVPLAPVMSFWLASPSMDPEVFFLSVGMLGWDIAIWRLGSTLIMSLSGGFLTHFLTQRGWLGTNILRGNDIALKNNPSVTLREGWQKFKQRVTTPGPVNLVRQPVCCTAAALVKPTESSFISAPSLGIPVFGHSRLESDVAQDAEDPCTNCSTREVALVPSEPNTLTDCQTDSRALPFYRRLLKETWNATAMIAKFMALAFFLTALIKFYLPST